MIAAPLDDQLQGQRTAKTVGDFFVVPPQLRDEPLFAPMSPSTSPVTASRRGSETKPRLALDVVVFAFDVRGRSHRTDAAESRRVIERLDEEFVREADGAFRFRFAGFVRLPDSSRHICGVHAVARRYERQIRAGLLKYAGRGPANWVAVSASGRRCGFPGQASLGRAGVHIPDEFVWYADEAVEEPPPGEADLGVFGLPHMDVVVLAHEIEHNLGLSHAGGFAPNGTDSPLRNPASFDEYGDSSQTLGGNRTTLHLSAYERSLMGILPVGAEGRAIEAGVYTITRLGESGTNLLYLPVDGRRTYAVEYRPGVGSDWPLRVQDEELADENGNLEDGGGAGVFVSLLGNYRDINRDIWPFDVGGPDRGSSVNTSIVLPSPGTVRDGEDYRTGLRSGAVMRLQGGITLRIGMADGTSVQVTVNR